MRRIREVLRSNLEPNAKLLAVWKIACPDEPVDALGLPRKVIERHIIEVDGWLGEDRRREATEALEKFMRHEEEDLRRVRAGFRPGHGRVEY
jgi:hypothetical protein